MSKAKAPRKKSQKQLLIEALLVPGSPINWALEMKTLVQILSKYPDVEFWTDFGSKKKYASLIHLLSDINGTNIIFRAYQDYTKRTRLTLKVPIQVKLEKEKVGEDIIIEQKPKTLFDFLNS